MHAATPTRAPQPALHDGAGVAEAPPAGAGAYEAPTADGPLRLALETVSGQPPGCAAEAALRLALAEPLLAALEDWLAMAAPPMPAPEWTWCAGPAGPSDSAAVARWAGVGVGARLALPWALLRRLPAPPAALAARLQWTPVAAEWVLATLALSEAEREALEPGGALLLVPSFEPDWCARLRAVGEPAPGGLPALLDVAGGAACPCPGAEEAAAPTSEDERWELRSPLSAPLAPELLLGWRDEPLPLELAQPLLLWRLPPGQAALPWAAGRLIPWGEGQALALDTVNGLSPSPWT